MDLYLSTISLSLVLSTRSAGLYRPLYAEWTFAIDVERNPTCFKCDKDEEMFFYFGRMRGIADGVGDRTYQV